MPRSALLVPAMLLVSACADAPTAPAAHQATGAPVLAVEGTVACIASGTVGSYSATVQWSRTRVRNVTLLLDEAASIEAQLAHPQRFGSVTFHPAVAPIGFQLDNGKTIVAQGGCTTP